MQALNDEFKEFLKLLNDNQVVYLIVGGYAVGFHGYPRFTEDIDIWIDNTEGNRLKIRRVLESFGFSEPDLKSIDLANARKIVKIGKEPFRIDLLKNIPGVRFDLCYSKRVESTIDGVRVPFISLLHLKKNKKATGRPQDHNDVAHLTTPKRNPKRLKKASSKRRA